MKPTSQPLHYCSQGEPLCSKRSHSSVLAKFDAPIASEIDPLGKVEAAITILKVKTWAIIAAEPYIEPPPPAHNAEEDSTDMNVFLEWASTAEVSRGSSCVSTPDRSSTPASSAEQIEVAIVKSGPSVWSERQLKFGTRDGSDTMKKGIPLARNVEGVKVCSKSGRNPDRGGDFAVFKEENLCENIILCCLVDVVLLAEFMEVLWKHLTKE